MGRISPPPFYSEALGEDSPSRRYGPRRDVARTADEHRQTRDVEPQWEQMMDRPALDSADGVDQPQRCGDVPPSLSRRR